MSGRLSLREAIDRQAAIPADRRVLSGSPVDLLLRVANGMPQPVAVARLLADRGVALRDAHLVIDRLAAGETLAVTLTTEDPLALRRDFEDLGLAVSAIEKPDVDAKAVREGYSLSQKDFATRFGLDLTTVQTWEQGRDHLDRAATILLALIRDRPDAVDSVLATVPRPE